MVLQVHCRSGCGTLRWQGCSCGTASAKRGSKLFVQAELKCAQRKAAGACIPRRAECHLQGPLCRGCGLAVLALGLVQLHLLLGRVAICVHARHCGRFTAPLTLQLAANLRLCSRRLLPGQPDQQLGQLEVLSFKPSVTQQHGNKRLRKTLARPLRLLAKHEVSAQAARDA